MQAIAAIAVMRELTREFSVEWIPRADGRGNEIKYISQTQMNAYSTRILQVHEKERELAQAWERRHGRAPTSRELLHIVSDLFHGGDPPDAVAAMSDELALGTLRAVARADLAVPGDVAITGGDDTGATAPARLTTVRPSLRDQGRRCVRIALGHDDAHEAQAPPA
jgi:DNA-binding LacI/PurR family transcriptional regulator